MIENVKSSVTIIVDTQLSEDVTRRVESVNTLIGGRGVAFVLGSSLGDLR